MADADSLHDMSSDLDGDPSAVEADVEDDENAEESVDPAIRKKNRRKKRKPHDIERSSGDSDNQMSGEKEKEPVKHLVVTHPMLEQCPSGIDADSESQGPCPPVHTHHSLHHHYVYQENTDQGPATDDKSDEEDEKDDDKGENEEDDKDRGVSYGKLPGLQQIQKAVELLALQQAAPKSIEEAKKKKYHFWETQPVPKFDEKITTNEEIEGDRPVEEVRKEPYSLPSGFVWDTLDIGDPLILKELYTLLNENYVEDDDNMFRFDYSPEFLQWALQPPGWLRDWHCGVRVQKSKKLVGFISGVPSTVKIYDRRKRLVEINFLCVHKKLRSKRVAPVLIREITRRVHCQGIFQAVYTAGVVLPKPVASCRYWHRSLNPRKLIEVKFSHLSRNMTMQRTLKLYKLPDSPRTPGFRPFSPADVPDAHRLLSKYLRTFDLAPMFSEEEFRHWFIPRPGIIDSYVVENHGVITDFVSFYTLPSTVMHHPSHKTLKAAYSFYNVSGGTPWPDLMQDALIVAKIMGFDVFNALDLMDNKQFLEKLKFGIGDGNLQYYLYNWRCPPIETRKVGLVLQ